MSALRRIVCTVLMTAACAPAPTAIADDPPQRPVLPVGTTAPEPTIPPPAAGAPVYAGFEASTREHPTLVALTRGPTPVYAGARSSEAEMVVPATTILGTATVLTSVGDPVGGRVEVMLPGRPNGRTGWVDVESVDLYVAPGRIVVDLSEKTLVYLEAGRVKLSGRVAVGSSSNPTPTGTFFVTDSVALADGDGPWGPRALGLSARSDTITEFNGGDGIIGIHGTSDPGSIGRAASLGCIRLHNDVIAELGAMVPLGTPVEIRR